MRYKKKAHNHSFAILAGVGIAFGVLIAANMKDILRYIRISTM
ncbi:MAG TPA: hypothetical protein VH815_09285 [Acidobacteriota bacterium]